MAGSAEEIEKIAIAAAFHDLGIWTDRTFDYLSPSANLARAYLTNSGRAEWIPEITETIFGHHKVSRYRGRDGWLVEPFRRADWMDVSMGVITFGLSRRLLEAALSLWPRAGFHKRLVAAGAAAGTDTSLESAPDGQAVSTDLVVNARKAAQ